MSAHTPGSVCPPVPPPFGAPPDEPPDADWEYHLQVPCDRRAPGIARTTLRAVLREHGLPGLVATAELLTSELVTNSVRYSARPVLVMMRSRDVMLRISVWDADPTLPSPLVADAFDIFGRGLFLVRRLADDWGRYTLPGDRYGNVGGKVIWFECCNVRGSEPGDPR